MLGVRLFLGVLVLAAATTVAADNQCLVCHSKTAAAGQPQAPLVDTMVLDNSIHADTECKDCHNVDPQERHVGAGDVLCGRCHIDAAEGYAASPHLRGREVSIENVPACVSCHGGHTILAVDDPESITNHRNSIQLCIKCHEDETVTGKFAELPKPPMIKAYENSVHGRALLVDGNMQAPACTNCHGSHSFMPSDNPESPLYKTHIAATCGQCHAEIAAEYQTSVHGVALAGGILESPTCTNCHGEHDIRAHLDPESKVFATHVPKTCSDCHTSERVVGKFGLRADRIATFKESFHGVATELGETTVANCASCHGVHNIYPQSDTRSLIHKDNIQATCGACHEDLPEDFAQAAVHTSASDPASGGEFYVRKFYIWFISILIIGFILYRVLEYKRRVKRV